MEHNEEPIQIIRESTRNLLRLNRQIHKDEINDELRSIVTARITPELLADIASRLKSKSTVTLSELHILKNSLIDDAKNIELVLGTHGALRGLVREISDNDIKRQIAAAGCCCNLALGDSKACYTVAKAAGPYLIAALDSLSEELAVTCAWALGNLAGSGGRACGALAAAGAGGALAARARAAGAGRAREAGAGRAGAAAVSALAQLAHHMRDEFSRDHLSSILDAYSNLELTTDALQLLFILSCHRHFPAECPECLLRRLLSAIPVSMQMNVTTCPETEDCYRLVYLLRTLAPLSVNKDYTHIILYNFMQQRLCVEFKKFVLSGNGLVRDSLLWLLGNLYNTCGENEFFHDLAVACSQ